MRRASEEAGNLLDIYNAVTGFGRPIRTTAVIDVTYEYNLSSVSGTIFHADGLFTVGLGLKPPP